MNRPRYFISFLVLVVVSVLTVASDLAALELWNEDPPRLPEGAIRTSVSRTVTHRQGAEVVATPLPHLLLEKVGDDRVDQTVYDDRGRYLWTTTFETEAGLLVEIRAADEQSVRWEMQFEYDEFGRPVRESYIGTGSHPERIIVYEYLEDAAEIVAYRGDGTVAWRRTETAGPMLDERETTFFYSDGSRVKTIVANVDDVDRVVSERHLDELGAVYRSIEREYAGGLPVLEVVVDETGSPIRRTEWSYDSGGRMVTRVIELPAETVVERLSVRYSFNERGDWVEQERRSTAQLDAGDPFVTDREILEREIDYR